MRLSPYANIHLNIRREDAMPTLISKKSYIGYKKKSRSQYFYETLRGPCIDGLSFFLNEGKAYSHSWNFGRHRPKTPYRDIEALSFSMMLRKLISKGDKTQEDLLQDVIIFRAARRVEKKLSICQTEISALTERQLDAFIKEIKQEKKDLLASQKHYQNKHNNQSNKEQDFWTLYQHKRTERKLKIVNELMDPCDSVLDIYSSKLNMLKGLDESKNHEAYQRLV